MKKDEKERERSKTEEAKSREFFESLMTTSIVERDRDPRNLLSMPLPDRKRSPSW